MGPETDDITPAVSTSSHAFQAILDDLVRTLDAPVGPVAPAAGGDGDAGAGAASADDAPSLTGPGSAASLSASPSAD
ncbi:preprotein translocase subunit SecG domain protein, partial [Leifsonia aquatica ATCC 14665]